MSSSALEYCARRKRWRNVLHGEGGRRAEFEIFYPCHIHTRTHHHSTTSPFHHSTTPLLLYHSTSLTMAKGVAVKSNLALWKHSKEMACRRGKLCNHSARKMQWAVQYYQKHGGSYSGKRKASNRLHQWTAQQWRTASGGKSNGRLRYLPDKAWSHLTEEQIRRTNRYKREGSRKGRQWVNQPRDVARIASRHRSIRSSGDTKR